MNWIKKALGLKVVPHVFARIDPDQPFSGMDHFSVSSDWARSIRIDGVTIEEAKRELCGKVLNWDLITVTQREDLKNKKLKMSLDSLKKIFR